MGLFSDMRKLSKQSKEIRKDWDPAAQMREASEMMQRSAAQASLATTGTRAPAIVNQLHDTGAMVNNQPMVEADVTVMPAAGVPFVSRVTLHGHAQLAGVQPGAHVNVLYDPATPSVAVLAF